MSLRRSTPITSEHSSVDTPRAIGRTAPQLIGGGAANAMLSLITVDAKDMTEISMVRAANLNFHGQGWAELGLRRASGRSCRAHFPDGQRALE